MTRVLEVLGRSAGGIARHVAYLVEALDGSAGLHLDVAAPRGLPIAMPKSTIDLEIPDGAFAGHPGAIVRLRRIAAGYDVVHAHGLRAGVDAGLAARRARRLVTVHNLVRTEIAGWKAPLHRRAEGLAVALADRTFAVSEDIARSLASAWPGAADRVEVLHLGIGDAPAITRPATAVRAELDADERPLVVSLARLAPQKAIHVLIDAARAVPDAIFAILGEGPLLPQLQERAAANGVAERVRFLGFRRDAADILAAGDVFCLSSIWEGVPLAAQEAILLGVPVVSTDVGGMRELIANKLSGRLVPPNDPGALAAALRDTLGARDDSARFAQRAREHLQSSFSTELMLARLRDAYQA